MSRSNRHLGCVMFATAMLAGEACAVSLEDDDPSPIEKELDVVTGCVVQSNAARPGFRSPLRSIDDVAVSNVWMAESNLDGDQNLVLMGAPDERCANPLEIQASNVLPSTPGETLTGLDAAFVENTAILFYSVREPDGGFGTTAGFGIATGTDLASVMPAPELLWTGDRPPYGSAVVVDATHVYAYGCLPARFLDADCYVARVERTTTTERSAYEYWAGSEQWVADADRAFPLLAAGTHLSVAFHAGSDRFLMAYSTPLGDRIVLRSGFGPTGPWSAPVEIGRCHKPAEDPDAFCAGIEIHPDLVSDPDRLAITYGLGSFSPYASEAPEAYRTRLAIIGVPTELP